MGEPKTMSRPGTMARPLAEITGPVRARLAFDIDEGETLSAADLLRLLDRLRQQLSRHLVGSTGAFIGYDSLTVFRWAMAGPGRVLMEASLARWSEQLHDVKYVAVSVPHGAERRRETDPVLVHGTGRTLHVDC